MLRDRRQLQELSKQLTEKQKSITDICSKPLLVSIHLRLHRGCLEQNDIICLPLPEDVEEYSRNNHYQGPVEEALKVTDTKKKEEKQRTEQMKKKRKRLSQKLKHLKSQNGNESHVKTVEFEIAQNIPAPKTLPNATTVMNSCSRKVIGYVTNGGYAFSQGLAIGSGCIVLCCLVTLMENMQHFSKPLVLVRNTKSLQYRFAHFHISTDV